ncbi:MAG: cytochrome b/b6 domain-containing protein [Anaerotardibacter sp.]
MAHLAHYKEAHPLPLAITHWINLICMALLIFTGFIIHFPFIAGLTGVARGLHVFCGIILFLNFIVRVVLAFLVQSAPTGGTRNTVRDYKTWLPQKDNRHQGISWIKYYLFLKKDHPLSAKLGVPQKISYLAVGVLILIMAYTGFALWVPTADWAIFAAGTAAVGGMMSMRIIHYFMMFVFICFTFIHVYLVFIEGTENANLMLLRKEHGGFVYDPDRHVIVGEDHSIGNH